MHRYHHQLKEDLQQLIAYKAKKEEYVPEDLDSFESFAECSLELHKYAHGTGEKVPIGTLTGIISEQLPPAERFTAEQRAELSPLLEQLLRLHHFELDFPSNVPNEMRYAFIRKFWSESHFPMRIGMSHIEFCDYDDEHCPFPGYCPACEEVRADYEQERLRMESGECDEDVPF